MVDVVRLQVSFLGYILRKDKLENTVVTGYVDGNVIEKDREKPILHTTER